MPSSLPCPLIFLQLPVKYELPLDAGEKQISPVNSWQGSQKSRMPRLQHLQLGTLKKDLTLKCPKTNLFHCFPLPSDCIYPIVVKAPVKDCSGKEHFPPCSPFCLKDCTGTFTNSILEGYVKSPTRTLHRLFQYQFTLHCQAFKQK